MGNLKTAPGDCALSDREQTRNVWIVGLNTALCYLASPVLYVDAVHTSLMNDLQSSAGYTPSDVLSNLPSSCYMAFSVTPLFVAWAFPQIRLLRSILVSCYVALAFACAAVVGVLLMPFPFGVQAGAVIAHGALVGACRTVAVAFEFEVLGLAVAEARRGQALGIAYGLGPILAIFASLLSQLLLKGQVGILAVPAAVFPGNFAAIFAVTIPILALGAFLCSRLIVPVPAREDGRQSFLTGIFGGFGQFLGRRVTLLAVVSSILVFCGYQVIDNMTLYTGALFGNKPSDTAGYQKAVLFTCKVLMGVSMGWVLTWAAPRSAVLISATVGMSAIIFAILAPPSVFLLSFGLLGAGQLHGIYATNYILSCAPRALMRKYMAFTMVTMLPAAPFGAIYGSISDHFGSQYGKLIGYQMSFVLAGLLVLGGILLILALPARPNVDETPA